MPIERITFRPGINRQVTPTLNEGGWSDGSRVRFRDGLPQPIGGWAKQFSIPVRGAGRKLHSWTTLAGQKSLGVGTSHGLYLGRGSTFYDITPVRTTATLINPFTTTAGSSTVRVTAPAHGLAADGGVVIQPASLAGLIISGTYYVAAVVDTNTFTITVAGTANASVSGGGSIAVSYLLGAGPVNVPFGQGWGAGPFGRGTWGTSRTNFVQSGALRLWSIDNWGEEMVACPRDGGIYRWRPVDGVTTRAALIPGAPTSAKGILVAMPERHLIAFGTNGDPMDVRFSDVEDYTTWNATATNSAGEFRLQGGSEIRAWAAGQGETLIWTDTTLYAMRFEAGQFVYGFFPMGQNCGAISPNAVRVMGGVAYWMGLEGFYRYAGQVEPVRCDVWDAVFRNLNPRQAAKVHCATNAGWNEVTWFYPSAGSIEVDSYVTLDVVNGLWSLGALDRAAWIDAGVFGSPLASQIVFQGEATVPVSWIYAHETGMDDDGQPMGSFVESGFFDIGDGAQISFIDELIPDFADMPDGSTVLLTLSAQMFPNGGTKTKGPFVVTNTTRHVSPRIRGRQIALRIESSGGGAFWRLGSMRARIAPDGRR